jgi:hypothetical protein
MGNTTSELQQATDDVQQEVEQEAAAAAQPEVRHYGTASICMDIIHITRGTQHAAHHLLVHLSYTAGMSDVVLTSITHCIELAAAAASFCPVGRTGVYRIQTCTHQHGFL